MASVVRSRVRCAVGQAIRAGFLLTCVAVVGCQQQMAFERWQTIEKGMSRAQVRSAMGEPWQETEQTWVYYDEQDGSAAMVWFAENEVIGTTWQCPQHGLLGESPISPPADGPAIGPPLTRERAASQPRP